MGFDIHELAAALGPKLIEYRRDFHAYPESGWTEFRTSALIAKKLGELGYRIRLGADIINKDSMMGVPCASELAAHMERAVAEGADADLVARMAGGLTGVCADLACGEGPVLALRFDIDANDVGEAEDQGHRPCKEGFASRHPNVMHACGHDGHAALGLGLAELLVGLKNEFKGTVRLIFQPAEEGVRGAGPMTDAGILDDVDVILGGHIGFLAKETGQFICGAEKFLATTKFDARFTGVSAHAGGAPEEGKNALLAAACAALNLHAITRHSQGASRITVGRLDAGQGRNVIPPNGLIKAETRGVTSQIDAFMFERAQQVVAGAAAMYDVDYDITLMGKTKSGASDPSMARRIRAVAEGIAYFDNERMSDIVTMGGSDDFAHMMSAVQERGGQGSYFFLGAELAAGHHNSYFDFDEACLVPGVEFLAAMVLDVLGSGR
ncbi:amidohydrolase [Desulfocurvus sp. DL9XJH121]